jgi:hypothetical protein
MTKKIWLVQLAYSAEREYDANLCDKTCVFSSERLARKAIEEFIEKHAEDGWQTYAGGWWSSIIGDSIYLEVSVLNEGLLDVED